MRVRASTSTTRPFRSCRITTRLASHARRCDVPAGTRSPVLQDGLAGLVGVGQDGGIHVDHHLVAFARGAGIDAVVEGGLGEQGERVSLLLGQGGRLLGHARRARSRRNAFRRASSRGRGNAAISPC